MHPTDLPLIRSVSRPAPTPDGAVFVSIIAPDVDHDRYTGRIHRITAATSADSTASGEDQPDREESDRADPVPFTHGSRDTAPVLSPDGRTLVFLRGTEDEPDQLFAIPVDGGEPLALTAREHHPLGVTGPAVFTLDGRHLLYTAKVPEAGRYGTDPAVGASAERPRRIRDRSYRGDGQGFVLDRPQQVFALDLAAIGRPEGPGPRSVPAPGRVTDELRGASDPVPAPDGTIRYVRPAADGGLAHEIMAAAVSADPDGPPAAARLLLAPGGTVTRLIGHGPKLLYFGVRFDGIDMVGRTTGLWSCPIEEPDPATGPVRMTDESSVDVDAAAGPPVVVTASAGNDRVFVPVHDRGSVALVAVPLDARDVALPDLARWTDPSEVLRSFAVAGDRLVTVLATGGSPGEVVVFDPQRPGPGRRLTDLAAPLRAAGLRPMEPITATAPDGYPVHGFLVRPAGAGPHPVLLAVHGGPHAAYTSSFFDEPQISAAAGYAVVLPNPRGSAGYGQDHGRAAVGQLGTVDVDDVLALLDEALRRPDCDAGRVGVMGGSYGGFMTTWLAGHHPERFTAAISERAVNAWDSFAGSSDIGYWFAAAYVGPTHDQQWAASPLAAADAIDIPMLIIHSEQDWRCPLEQAQRLFVALANRDVPVEMVIFPGEGHELSRTGRPRHRADRFAAILDWWARQLPVDSAPASAPAPASPG